MTNRNIGTLIAGLLFLGLGSLFLAVNVYGVEIDWWMGIKLILPALFIWAGVLKLWRHFTWPLEKLKERPGKAGLLSGIFWLSLGSVIALAVFDVLDFLPAAGMYWPVVLLAFGLGKIIDFSRAKEIAGSNFSEIAGVVFIILFGLSCMKMHQLNVLILEQDPFWERIPEFIGIEELIEPTVEHSISSEVDLKAATVLEVRNAYGDVLIEGTESFGDKISTELGLSMREKDEARAKSIFDKVRIEAVEENGVMVVSTNRGELKSLGKKLTTTLRLKVPSGLKVDVKNDYGDIEVEDVKNGCILNSRKGDVTASSISGMVQVYSGAEMVELSEISGDVEIDAKFTEVDVEGVLGNVSIITSRQPVHVSRVGGDLKVENRHDDVTASEIGGSVEVNNPGGDVKLSEILGEVNAVNSKGDVFISEAAGKVILVSAYGDVTLEDMASDIDVTVKHAEVQGARFGAGLILRGSNSSVNFEDVAGDLLIETSQEPVYVSRARGMVNIQNDLGKVHLKIHRKPDKEIRMESRQGDITLELPGTAEFALNAKVTNGNIVSEFGKSPKQDSRGDSVFETVIGEGGPKVNISTSGSVIEIRRVQ